MSMIVLTAGQFGIRVGQRLAQLCDAEAVPLPQEREHLELLIQRADFVAVATWRPYVQSCTLIDDLCFRFGVRWSLAEIHAQRLTCGPLVNPGNGACYQCYRKRWLTHHKSPEREQVLNEAYERDSALGPTGSIGPLVEVAAQALADDAVAADGEAGRLRLVDVLSGAVLKSGVMGIHECPRCRPAKPARTGERFVQHMVPEIERMLG
ncbi:TOMM precursor leader peptide-binding protein [Microbulbifer sp. 2205BS26-8]|uniref:TOMM precursor leader peptide-binding protein n=1 Tax=Microbulbifer sp. 2205BS26-8 TaxID=3064386 RepID=UPI00273F0831|nr:TOMM precursor leader peptide-binding protein [Microbulbifer sp. 2205BS26-8]MDP5210779.1 TOMM precursor leader peptide-binding protein [Microbulbifer sp. 2205BS26-8]